MFYDSAFIKNFKYKMKLSFIVCLKLIIYLIRTKVKCYRSRKINNIKRIFKNSRKGDKLSFKSLNKIKKSFY